ncbi:hypothetical protein [Bradyrhizobium sp. Ai1a-2]|uniref:hypothetical protein n=1 Tax=Bradyrhizobium sp. Ai1a-2 TaxID=196490 RepID=UPI0004078652|nr:hypothetical protein [Bradyrhizobium sp. Ai1a-2]
MSWQTPFEQPIALPEGEPLITLQDAASYIQRLPADISGQPEWQLAIEMLIEAAEERTFRMFARIAVLKAMNDGTPRDVIPPTARRKKAKVHKIISQGRLWPEGVR